MFKKLSILGLCILAVMVCMTACSKKSDQDAMAQNNTTKVSAAAETQNEVATVESSAEPEVQTEEQSAPKVDTTKSVDSLLGSWVSVDTPESFVNVTKTEGGYEYEDNDGTYTATYKEGILSVAIAEGDIAEVYFNSNSQHLVTVYQGSVFEFKMKE